MHLDGVTEDLAIAVAPEHTLDELVDYIVVSRTRGTSTGDLLHVLTHRFALSAGDADLALDRVSWGETRARSADLENAPDAAEDPVASIAFRRAMGEAAQAPRPPFSKRFADLIDALRAVGIEPGLAKEATAELAAGGDAAEREAGELFCHAVDSVDGTMRDATSAAAALRLLELAGALAESGLTGPTLQRVLLQVDTAIVSVGELRIRERGAERHARARTRAWFDAVRLGQAAGELSRLFVWFGSPRREGHALELQVRIVTSLLGHCQERVGKVTLELIRYGFRTGDGERATRTCEAMVADFCPALEACERGDASWARRRSVSQLAEALDVLASARPPLSYEEQSLRERCASVLAH